MINFDDVFGENIKEDNANWSQIPDQPYRELIVGISESGKTNALLNLINISLILIRVYTLNIYMNQISTVNQQTRDCTLKVL